jgi:hypothetical protein
MPPARLPRAIIVLQCVALHQVASERWLMSSGRTVSVIRSNIRSWQTHREASIATGRRFGFAAWAALILALPGIGPLSAQQIADPDFDASVRQKAYAAQHPLVVVDEAHNNFHTAGDRYEPLARLLRNDGYEVVSRGAPFAGTSLNGVRVFVTANARSSNATERASGPAFSEQDCDLLQKWVREGGSLLLIADHTPFGEASASLASRFGVQMGMGIAFDVQNFEIAPTIIVFSIDNAGLGDHPILKGRNDAERLRRIVAFGGQSLSLPAGATALLKFSPTARESRTQEDLKLSLQAIRPDGPLVEDSHSTSTAGRAQGVALQFGKGRVVILGEAALLSAQLLKSGGPHPNFKFGMNTPGNDDKQFALNVMHWLSGAL